MNDNQRIPLKVIKCDKTATGATKGKVLYLKKEGSANRSGDFFKINKIIEEDSICVCYEATLSGQKKVGRLKEFYPSDSIFGKQPLSMTRNEYNHIVSNEKSHEAFRAACNDFVESYHLIRNIAMQNKKNAGFKSFVPDFSVYYACDENGKFIENSTAYIWSETQNFTAFEKYIADIQRYPGSNSEDKLFTILKTVLTLAKYVKILHENDLFHLDINPAIFGILCDNGELNADSVSLFDISTNYLLYSDLISRYGKEGFRAPELAEGKADKTSDIYSIGCTLFSALIVRDGTNKSLYSPEYYENFLQMVKDSKLISSSETNSSIYLTFELAEILKKCLAENPKNRYQSCEELAKDLQKILSNFYVSETVANAHSNQRLDVMKKEQTQNRAGTHLSLLYHLYNHPLFEDVENCTSTDILIVGFGNYGQKFLDCCLQFGQVTGRTLNVHVISNNRISEATDKAIYLKNRPALSDFFNIDGNTVPDAYGNIVFQTEHFFTQKELRENAKKQGDKVNNNDPVFSILGAHEVQNKFFYIFIALGDDWLNKNVAQEFSQVASSLTIKSSINFVLEKEQKTKPEYGNPVVISKDITTEAEYKEIERMAFNTHLAWEDGLNIDTEQAWKSFKSPYNYISSFSYAVSVKYKLHSLGLSMDNLSDTAKQYIAKFDNNEKLRNKMIAAEHRRWNCEKICEGYTCNKNLKSCIFGGTRDKENKKHICLVRSNADAPLQTPLWNREKWDTASKKEIELLDELDQLSIKLHQTYKKHADNMKKNDSPFGDIMKQLKTLCDKDINCQIAFSEWFSALSLLWSGDTVKLREYTLLKDKLLHALKVFKADDRSTAISIVDIIDEKFTPILKSLKYTDWKQTDARLVDAIPFILTYKRNLHLAIPMVIDETGGNNNSLFFKNVATPTVVNPSRITYIHYFTGADLIAPFKKAFKYISKFLTEKNITAKLSFVLAYKKGDAVKKALEDLKSELEETPCKPRILLVDVEDEDEIGKRISPVLEKTLRADAIERTSSSFSGYFSESPLPKYRFDINNRRFYDVKGCDYLKYIRISQYFRATDMFAAKNSKGVLESPLTFYKDYQKLWDKAYSSDYRLWKYMCAVLAKYHENFDTIVQIKNNDVKQFTEENKKIEEYRYLVPASSFTGASKIINDMIKEAIFEKNSSVSYYTPDVCEIKIFAQKGFSKHIRSLFDTPEYIAHPEQLEVIGTQSGVNIQYNSLKVCNLNLQQLIDEVYQDRGNAKKESVADIKKLLTMLEEDFAYIYGFTESGNSISFHYPNEKIKHLLTNEGNILEIYIYVKCLRSGFFDDVVNGYEVTWDDTTIKNEFDIVITKGFRTLLIEVKAQRKIQDIFYYKLDSLDRQFGTNTRLVLVADTQENPKYTDESNSQQRGRGESKNIITIYDSQEIDEIDKTLRKLLEADDFDTAK